MHLLHRCDPAFLQAVLTERMALHVSGSNASPAFIVALGSARVALVLVVLPVAELLVFLAVPPFRQPGAAGPGAWALGFPGHCITSNEKSPAAGQDSRAFFIDTILAHPEVRFTPVYSGWAEVFSQCVRPRKPQAFDFRGNVDGDP